MEIIEDVVDVYANGKVIPRNLPERDAAIDPVKWEAQYRDQIGAQLPVVATRWTYRGKSYDNEHCPDPLPDMSGLVYVTPGWKQWVVVNPDGSTRVVIEVPRVREHSKPAEGDLGNPRHSKGTPPYVMYGEGSDGYQEDCRFFFDMRTGELLRTEFMSRHW